MERKKSKIGADINQLYGYFKRINYCEEIDQVENDNLINLETNEFLNKPVTIQEIENAIKHLKNNKASGNDNIKNEHLKCISKN